jgi:hypothetical protein
MSGKMNANTLLWCAAKAGLTADLVSAGGQRLNVSKPIQNARVIDRLLIADDMTFFAIPPSASGVAVYFGNDELCCFDRVIDRGNPPSGGDLLVPFTNGIMELKI